MFHNNSISSTINLSSHPQHSHYSIYKSKESPNNTLNTNSHLLRPKGQIQLDQASKIDQRQERKMLADSTKGQLEGFQSHLSCLGQSHKLSLNLKLKEVKLKEKVMGLKVQDVKEDMIQTLNTSGNKEKTSPVLNQQQKKQDPQFQNSRLTRINALKPTKIVMPLKVFTPKTPNTPDTLESSLASNCFSTYNFKFLTQIPTKVPQSKQDSFFDEAEPTKRIDFCDLSYNNIQILRQSDYDNSSQQQQQKLYFQLFNSLQFGHPDPKDEDRIKQDTKDMVLNQKQVVDQLSKSSGKSTGHYSYQRYCGYLLILLTLLMLIVQVLH